jgi:proline iminopeptidase
MTALANILTSDRLKVDVARQVRVWSGSLYDDKDYEAAIPEMLPIFAPPEDPSNIVVAEGNVVSKKFEGLDESSGYHSATQNAAFSVNVPRFDVRHQLKDIKVKKKSR